MDIIWLRSWGFIFKTVGFTWVKETKHGKDHFGVGMWTRKNPEMCLLATKGKPKRVSAGVRQLQRHKVREHSRKPDSVTEEILGNLIGSLIAFGMICLLIWKTGGEGALGVLF